MTSFYEQKCRDWHKVLCQAANTNSVEMMEKAYEWFNMPAHVTAIANKENCFGETPLILACFKGHLDVAKYLVERYSVDVNQRATLFLRLAEGFKARRVSGTALHAAVLSGNSELVRYLVEVCQANINVITSKILLSRTKAIGGYTPLHVAVTGLKRRVPEMCAVVYFLLQNGADWTIREASGKQCWELTWNAEVTTLMIHFGVGLDASGNSTRSNIVHKWANSEHPANAIEVISLALTRCVDLNQPDNRGLTPLMIAAIGPGDRLPDKGVFDIILALGNSGISRQDKITAHELIGASYIRFDQMYLGLRHWRTAMELRFAEEPHLPKPSVSLCDSARLAFKGMSEAQNLQEMEDLYLLDDISLRVHALLTTGRILGFRKIDVLKRYFVHSLLVWKRDKQNFLDYAKFFIDQFNILLSGNVWEMCTAAIFLAIYTINKFKADPFNTPGLNVYDNTMPFLMKLVDILKKISTPMFRSKYLPPDHKRCILIAILSFVDLMVTSVQLDSPEGMQLKRCLYEAVRLQARTKKGCDLLLLACIPLNDSYRKPLKFIEKSVGRLNFKRSLSAKVISLLLEVGADPNSTNRKGATGLHMLARYRQTFDSPTAMVLLEAGTHKDQRNRQGQTAAELMAISPLLEIPSLTCLCANVIHSRPRIPISKELPPNMAEFIKLH